MWSLTGGAGAVEQSGGGAGEMNSPLFPAPFLAKHSRKAPECSSCVRRWGLSPTWGVRHRRESGVRCRGISTSVGRLSEVLLTGKDWKRLFGKHLLPVCQRHQGLMTHRSSDVSWAMAERQ